MSSPFPPAFLKERKKTYTELLANSLTVECASLQHQRCDLVCLCPLSMHCPYSTCPEWTPRNKSPGQPAAERHAQACNNLAGVDRAGQPSLFPCRCQGLGTALAAHCHLLVLLLLVPPGPLDFPVPLSHSAHVRTLINQRQPAESTTRTVFFSCPLSLHTSHCSGVGWGREKNL